MIEIKLSNDFFFKEFYKKCPLDEVMESLEIARTYNLPHSSNLTSLITPFIPLMESLYHTGVVKNYYSFEVGIAKTATLSDYYREHSKDCDEAIARWNTGK